MTFRINTHDAWGVVTVGEFQTLAEAREAFNTLCQDPWYRNDGSVKALELEQGNAQGDPQRLAWFGFQ